MDLRAEERLTVIPCPIVPWDLQVVARFDHHLILRIQEKFGRAKRWLGEWAETALLFKA
jgi:hypothetical protein